MKLPFLPWAEGLANAFTKGLTDGFLVVAGGSAVVQAVSSGAVAPSTLKTILTVSIFNAVVDSARYVNGNPLFPIATPQPTAK